jgi:hypothetical protein
VLGIEECLLIAENNTGHMAGTTTRRMPEVTTKSTLIKEIVKWAHSIKRLLLSTRPDSREALTNIVKFADTVENLNAKAIRATPADLYRVETILIMLEKWINSKEFTEEVDSAILQKILDQIDYVKKLINNAAQQFKYAEE